jgi:acetyltransferase-like isoleucine patch superfamily enzyme
MEANVSINSFIRNVKRGETPFYRLIRSILKGLLNPRPPRIPAFLKPLLRAYYQARTGIIIVWRWLVTVFYRYPLFQARCASFGKNVSVGCLPFVSGHVEIHIGDDVSIGSMSVTSGRFIDRPQLIIKDRAQIGRGVYFSVNKEIVVEEDVTISSDCRISDNDGHPRQADLRARNAPLDPRDIHPVRIRRHACIGNGCQIMKGVTIGEGAVIGAYSVVISNIPPYCLAMGNPAEVHVRNYGQPAADQAAGTPNR